MSSNVPAKVCDTCSSKAGFPVTHEGQQLVHNAYEMFLTRIAKYDDPNNEEWDWRDVTNKWERHAFAAFRDLLAAIRASRGVEGVTHWLLKPSVSATACGIENYERLLRSVFPERVTCESCQSAIAGYKMGRAAERRATPSPQREVWDKAIALLPDNWVDSILTGPDAVLRGSGGTWGISEIEAVIRAIKKRLEAARDADTGEGS